MDEKDDISMMWWNPTPGDFISSNGGVVDGIGKLRRARLDFLLDMRKQLEERIRSYCANHDQCSSFYDVLLLLERDMHNSSSRIGSLNMTFTQMVFQVTEFQRCYLETRGLLDYLEVYLPRMNGRLEAATSVTKYVGAITSKPSVVQDFFTAGLPVWFIQPLAPGSFPHNVLNVVTAFEPSDFVCVERAVPPFPAIYDGPLDSVEKHNALHRFSRKWLVFKDPFQHQPTIQVSTSTRMSTSSASASYGTRGRHCKYIPFFCVGPVLTTSFLASRPQSLRPNQSAGRDKFSPLDSPLAPFSMHAWAAALQAVDRHFVSHPSTNYAFPDPGLFVSPTTDQKKARFIETWVRVRAAWIVRIVHEGLSMSSQDWRDLLSTDLNDLPEAGNSDTKAAKRRLKIRDKFTPTSSDPGVMFRSTVGEPFVWQYRSYLPGVLPATNVVRQILWELYELNFTYEFIALDRRACKNLDLMDNERLLERESLISKCFVIDTFKSAPLPNHNCGLAADDLRDRLPYLREVVRVMMAWKGSKPTTFDRADLPLDDHHAELEVIVAKYYCQQFYDYFGRAAQVPHRLFPAQY